ncbi:Crp/Fnr family transcriptional regulator [Streptomyces graminifolii]|uniref:Crp/Fnr family transcriptional regulator n=1 Tax=Streptomyces graminifolii TaxID=1266771 RepID=UPI0040585CB6
MPPSMALRVNHALPTVHRERLLRFGREVRFPPDTRLFEEGGHADRFWIIQHGTVALDMQVPYRRPPVVETLGVGDLVGWSWLYESYAWQLGAGTVTQVQAHEFDAVGVRLLCLDDAEFGRTVEHWVGRVLAHRLTAARALLVSLSTQHGTEES